MKFNSLLDAFAWKIKKGDTQKLSSGPGTIKSGYTISSKLITNST